MDWMELERNHKQPTKMERNNKYAKKGMKRPIKRIRKPLGSCKLFYRKQHTNKIYLLSPPILLAAAPSFSEQPCAISERPRRQIL